MNLGYIDTSHKPSIFTKKPKMFTFDNGNKLYLFPQLNKQPRIISKLNLLMIDNNSESFCKEFVYTKAILQILKEKNLSEITFCLDNPINHLYILEFMFKNNISFSLSSCMDSDNIVEYFLEKFGHPIRILKTVKTGLFVYLGGTPPRIEKNVLKLDLRGSMEGEKTVIAEYFIKNKNFPVKITSLSMLDAAIKLLDADKSDIIIKFCIIKQQEE